MLEIVVCDDNQIHNKFVCGAIERTLEQHKLPGKIALIAEKSSAVWAYAKQNPGTKLFVLDISLEHQLAGIDLATRLRETDIYSYIVFITAHQEYSLIGYKANTFDFLVKPLSINMVEDTLLRVFRDYHLRKNLPPDKHSFPLKSGSIIHNIPFEEILFMEKTGNILHVNTVGGTISGYETLMNALNNMPANIVRCHKSFALAADKVRCFNKSENYVEMINGQKCLVSRKYKTDILNAIGENHDR